MSKNINKESGNDTNNNQKWFWIFIIIISSLIFISYLTTSIILHFAANKTSGFEFIGFIAAFIGIMVTFAIGFQIYNALELKNGIEKEREKMEEERINNSKKFSDLEDEFNRTNKRLEISIEVRTGYTTGELNYKNEDFKSALYNYFDAFLYALDYIEYENDSTTINKYNWNLKKVTHYKTPTLRIIMIGIINSINKCLCLPDKNSKDLTELINEIKNSNFFNHISNHKYNDKIKRNTDLIFQHLILIEQANYLNEIRKNSKKPSDIDNFQNKINEIETNFATLYNIINNDIPIIGVKPN